MKFIAVSLCTVVLCFLSTTFVFAQTVTTTPSPTPSITANQDINNTVSNGSVLNSFISGFDWISSGLIFYTPSIMDQTIKLQDGTELAGMSEFRKIFYDIAIPLFVLITSAVAFSHISNDNAMQLRQFFKRLLFVVVLFMLTPAILTYSIQFVNLLNEKIIAQNSYNLSTLVNNFLSGFMQIPTFQQLFGVPVLIPSWNTVLQLIILIISVGFLLIGFIYIVFQAIIRFIALLVLSIIFPVVLPFALSEKTENIANSYFRTWFSFLIQQPAFVLGFAIVSALLTSILQAHNNSIGTLFVYSGALLFLGGINVFIGKIFGDGWSLLATNAQSLISSRTINKNVQGVARNENVRKIPSYAGRFAKNTVSKVKSSIQKHKLTQFGKPAYDLAYASSPNASKEKRVNIITKSSYGLTQNPNANNEAVGNGTGVTKANIVSNTQHPQNTSQNKKDNGSLRRNKGNFDELSVSSIKTPAPLNKQRNTLTPIKVRKPDTNRSKPIRKEPPKRIVRRKINI